MFEFLILKLSFENDASILLLLHEKHNQHFDNILYSATLRRTKHCFVRRNQGLLHVALTNRGKEWYAGDHYKTHIYFKAQSLF